MHIPGEGRGGITILSLGIEEINLNQTEINVHPLKKLGGGGGERKKEREKKHQNAEVYFLVVSLDLAGLKRVLIHGVNKFLQKPHKSYLYILHCSGK